MSNSQFPMIKSGGTLFSVSAIFAALVFKKNVLNTKDAKIAKAFVAESACRIHAPSLSAPRRGELRACPALRGSWCSKKMF
jgi:hypothetical protein